MQAQVTQLCHYVMAEHVPLIKKPLIAIYFVTKTLESDFWLKRMILKIILMVFWWEVNKII